MSSSIRENDSKRKRLTQACELCRKKKIKCDGEKPSCKNCARVDNECTYSSSNKKRGPRQGYIEMLEQRLAKMEKILLSPQEAGNTAAMAAPAPGTSSNNNNQVETEEEMFEDEEEYDDFIDPATLPGPSTFETASNNTSYAQSTLSQQSQSQPQLTPHYYANANNKGPASEDAHEAHSPTSFSSISSNFPSPPPSHFMRKPTSTVASHNTKSIYDTTHCIKTLEHMVDIYMKYIYPYSPIFDENSLRRDIQDRKASDFLLYSLMAACARFSDWPDIQESPAWRAGEKYAEKARTMMITAVDEPSVSNLQALTLLTLHEYGCGRGPRSWMYGGMAIRMAIEMGLHEDAEDNSHVDSSGKSSSSTLENLINQEARRRLFWTVFTIDKYSSAATGRPSSIQENYCTAFLPAKIVNNGNDNMDQYYTETLDNSRYIFINVNELRDSQLLANCPTNNAIKTNRRPYLDRFAYMTRATSLLGKITAYVNSKKKETLLPPFHPKSEFSKLDKEIEDWYEQLPSHLKNTPANFQLYACEHSTKSSQFILLHVLHNTLQVLLHRPSLVVADTLDTDLVQPEIKEFVSKSVEKCMASVDNVTMLLKEIGQCNEPMPPFIIYLAYTVATVVVTTSLSPRPAEAKKAKQVLGIYFQVLLNARNYWAMADKLYFMIRDLYSIHENVLRRQRELQAPPSRQPFNQQPQDQQPHYPEQIQQQQQHVASQPQQSPPLQHYQQPEQANSRYSQQSQTLADLLPASNVSNSNNPTAATGTINNVISDWTLLYYEASMGTNVPAEAGFFGGLVDSDMDLSTGLFNLPQEQQQQLMFPSAGSSSGSNDIQRLSSFSHPSEETKTP